MKSFFIYIPTVCMIIGIVFYNFQNTKKCKESLVPISPVISSIVSSPTSDAPDLVNFVTDSRINYNEIDNTIDELTQQYDGIQIIADNIRFKQTATTGSNPNIDPFVAITGSFPSNISLQFIFPPPKMGETGQSGVIGEHGIKGKPGKLGIMGKTGYYDRT